jgi:DMSO/TMAO reductase YedYZ molybdopterin-dependent catalytic subunit
MDKPPEDAIRPRTPSPAPQPQPQPAAAQARHGQARQLRAGPRVPRLGAPHLRARWLRAGPLRPGAFRSNLHDERTSSLVGVALGICFFVAFFTGLISHLLQHPPSWLPLLTRPVWIYRLTQGLHVATGLAAIPLLGAKLWTVYPKLFTWPPLRSLAHALERVSIAVLVAGASFELATGVLNIVHWYPWQFPFTAAHYWVAWVTVGALVTHLGVKAPAIARGLRRGAAAATAGQQPGAVSRRAFLTMTGAAVAAVTMVTVGQSVTQLRRFAVLAPRDPRSGPQHVPVNRTAAQARVTEAAMDPSWRLVVRGPRPYQLTLAELAAMPQHRARLPIACVEGWSVDADWTGVRVRDLLDRAQIRRDASIWVVSLERRGAYSYSRMESQYTRDPLTLLALRLNGAPLSVDHGYPARIIAPGRPGVLQTKWVHILEAV